MSTTMPPSPKKADPSWYPDPGGSHQYRYHDGARWTDHIADDGLQGVDPWSQAPSFPPVAPSDPSPTGSDSRKVYGSGTWDFVFVLFLCFLFPFVALWYGPKLLLTGYVVRGLVVLGGTAVWYLTLIQTL